MANIEIKDLRSATDLALFAACREGRFVTLEQAGRHIWAHPNAAARRVRQLERADYLRCYTDRYLRQTIIRPLKRAFDALRERGLISEAEYGDRWSWGHLKQRKIGHASHECRVNEIRFALLWACRICPGVKLMSCRSGPPIWRECMVDGKLRSLRPDREIELAVPDSTQAQVFFVEVDLSSRTIEGIRWTIAKQMTVYDEYVRMAERPFRVVVLCQSRARIESIVEKLGLGRALARGRAYGLLDDYLANPLGRVLTREADGAACSLIEQWKDWPA